MRTGSGIINNTATNRKESMILKSRRNGVKLGLCLLFVFCLTIYYRSTSSYEQEKIYGWVVDSSVNILDEDSDSLLGLTSKNPVILRNTITGEERILHGRFLHITDIHPDRYYKEGASIDKVCHFNADEGEHEENSDDKAPFFGKAMAGCDSPVSLMNHTLKWIADNLKDKIDFVIWTGDNIRHDNDRRNPRTEFQIFEMNEIVAGQFKNIFGNKKSADPRNFDVPVIPSLGNNDVFPHNLFSLGPTLQTRELSKIWGDFIPEEQQRYFDRGASFIREVIPGKLAVLSINTLYLFKANPLVDNCDSPKQPGYQLLLWLGYVLDELRERNMKVWLSGHVPPIEKNFEPTCFNKFALWTHEYRDVIIGSVFGHMNVDHFIPVDGEKAWKNMQRQGLASIIPDDDDSSFLDSAIAAKEAHLLGTKPENKESYIDTVKEKYYQKVKDRLDNAIDDEGKKKKKKGHKKPETLEQICERYSIVNIDGSVVPTFNPSIRIYEYNISSLETDFSVQNISSWDEFFVNLEKLHGDEYETDDGGDFTILGERPNKGNVKKGKKSKKGKKRKNRKDPTIPKRKPVDKPLGPAYTEQSLSPLRYVQYYADLKEINQKYIKLIKEGMDAEKAAHDSFRFKIEYTSDSEPYKMKSLLVKDYLDLAASLVDDEEKWEIFKRRAFVSSGYTDDS